VSGVMPTVPRIEAGILCQRYDTNRRVPKRALKFRRS